MRVAITGSTGLAGTAVARALREEDHEVTRVVRTREAASRAGSVYWRPSEGQVDAAGFEGHDVVIHLAAENLFGVWTPGKRRRIRESRIEGTGLLARTLAGLERKPRTLLMASAVGYYGDRPDADGLDESAPRGDGFLAEVVEEWEAAAEPARSAGIRVVAMRQGILLSRDGGALPLMLPAFKLGLGGIVGGGEQMFPWLARSELSWVVRHLLEHQEIGGAVNVTSPNPVSHGDFVRTLGRVLGRPTPFRIPAVLTKALPGDFAEETLLVSTPAVPARLLESGYRFRWPDLEGALRHELGR